MKLTSLALIGAGLFIGAPAFGQRVLFEDRFERPDSSSPGPGWREFLMRGAVSAGDSPWSIRGHGLVFDLTGGSQYVEDFVVTADAFPVEGTRVEFDWKGQVSTRQGYVGPAALWLDDPARRVGAYNLAPGPGFLGLAVHHKWETQGSRGILLFAGGVHHESPDVLAPGINSGQFAHHAITVRNGQLTWEAQGQKPITLPLDQPLEPGARRRFMFSVRLYDAGVPQRVEVRNFRIVALDGASPPQGGAGHVFQADFGGRAVRLEALAGSQGDDGRGGKVTSLHAAGSKGQLLGEANLAALSFRGTGAGTYTAPSAAALSFTVSPREVYLSTGGELKVVVSRCDATACEGTFSGRVQRYVDDVSQGAVPVTGSFRAPVSP